MLALPDPSPASAPSEELPRPFGPHYVLVDRIGMGGMAEIYLARGQTRSGAGRLAVVKLVLPRLARDERFSALLVQEAKLAAQLSHGNIVQTFDLGREAGRLFIAMEYVEGFDLNELLKRCSRAKVALPLEFALLIVGETLKALDYAHRKKGPDGRPLGVVHRDVSPSNVLVSFEGEVKLCDFGIARAFGTGDAPPEAIEGKASYMSPEHARGESLDARSDVFSASVILWELIAGRRMYRGSDGTSALELARRGEAPPLPERAIPGFERLREIVLRGLAPSPDARFASAHAMAAALDEYVMDHQLMATPMALGDFVVEHFGQEILQVRRARERAAIALAETAETEAFTREPAVRGSAPSSPTPERNAATGETPPSPRTSDADFEPTTPSGLQPSSFAPEPTPSGVSVIPQVRGHEIPASWSDPGAPLVAVPPYARGPAPPSAAKTTAMRLAGLLLGALVTIALGALLLSRS